MTAFYGNPYVTITSIDESGGIVCPRTSGQVPFNCKASASAIISSDTDTPFEDLFFKWDYGDGSSSETFLNPGVGGGIVNSNSDEIGPEADHIYRAPGTYTLALDIFGYNSLGLVRKTVTQQITVTDFTPAASNEFWLDSVDGNDTNNGLSIGAPKQTVAGINAVISNAPSQLAINIKRGSTFDGSDEFKPWASPSGDRSGLRIRLYGSGDDPSFNVSSGTGSAFFMWSGGSGSPRGKDDIVISDIDFSTSGTNTGYPVSALSTGNPTKAVTNFCLDNCKLHKGSDADAGTSLIVQGTLMTGVTLWNCDLTSDLVVTNETLGAFVLADSWFTMVGGKIRGGTWPTGLSTGREHHLYIDVQNHTHIRWVDGQEGPNRNYFVNGNWDHLGVSLPEMARYHYIGFCHAKGVQRFRDLGEQLNDPTKTLFRDVLDEGNRMENLEGDGSILFSCAETYTARRNQGWGFVGRWYSPSSVLGGILKSQVYDNDLYHPATVNSNSIIDLGNAAFTLRHLLRGNQVQDMRTVAHVAAIPFSGAVDADFDQYYAPNDANLQFLKDVATEKTFAQWQAAGFDINGIVQNPEWIDPANGNFDVVDQTTPSLGGGGGASHPSKMKAEKERRQRLKQEEEQLEQTIRKAYQRLTGKVTEPPQLKQDLSPPKLAMLAEKMAEQLIEKSKDSAKQRTRNKEIIKDLQRQAAAIMQEEEEAIVMLLH